MAGRVGGRVLLMLALQERQLQFEGWFGRKIKLEPARTPLFVTNAELRPTDRLNISTEFGAKWWREKVTGAFLRPTASSLSGK